MSPNVAGQKQSTAGGGGWLSSVSSAATSLVSSVVGGAKGTEGQDEGLSFADVAPYLVISSKSWEEAQSRLPEGEVMDISKFRPNIIVEGAAEEYEEDFWAEISIGDQGAKIVMTNNCGRCNSLNVDYNTGKVGEGEAGKILKKLNSNRRVDPGTKWSPVFGRYGFLAKVPEGKSAAEIRVGDEVVVVKRNENRTTFGMCRPLPLLKIADFISQIGLPSVRLPAEEALRMGMSLISVHESAIVILALAFVQRKLVYTDVFLSFLKHHSLLVVQLLSERSGHFVVG
jgi:uncharacterized protein YcbX